MENPKNLWDEFQEEWENNPNEVGALYYVVIFLKGILEELRGHRPVELEPVQGFSEVDWAAIASDPATRKVMRQIDAEIERRLSELSGTTSTMHLRETETAHGNRLDLVKHTAVEELNVAPQVAEYARRILMGCRPEPDEGVLWALFGYTGEEPPEGYVLVSRMFKNKKLDRGMTAELLRGIAVHNHVHPAAAELARRILAGEGPTVTVFYRVRSLTHEEGPPQTGLISELRVVDLELQTVLVVEPDVDLKPGDLGEENPDV